MRGPLGNLMQQAQRMQEQLKKAQDEIAKLEVTGAAGGGMVTVVMDGRHNVRKVRIDPSVLGDGEMLEDLITAACNDATNKLAEASQQPLSGLAGALPPGFKLPF